MSDACRSTFFRLAATAGFLLITAFTVPGCTMRDSEDAPQAETQTAEPATAENASPAASDVQLSVLTFEEMQQKLAEKRGKVVVMDAWSTSCPPCMKDFHNLVELHQQYAADGLDCVSLSLDYEGLGKPEDVQDNVLGFLKSQQATFDNWMSSEESDVLYRKFELNAVPAVFVYDRSGKLRERFEAEGAYDQVRKLVAELIEQDAETEASDAPAADASPDGASAADDSAGANAPQQ